MATRILIGGVMKTKLFAFFFLFSNILGQNFNNLLINDLILDNEKIFVVGSNYDNSLQVVRTQINDTSQQTIIFKKVILSLIQLLLPPLKHYYLMIL